MVLVFGRAFLFLVSTVYWVKGFKSFSGLAVNYLIKDELKLEPAVTQVLTPTMYIPWGIKPIYVRLIQNGHTDQPLNASI